MCKIQKFHLISRWEYVPLTENFRRFLGESYGIHFEYLFIHQIQVLIVKHGIFQIFIILKSNTSFHFVKHGYEATSLKRWFHYEYLGEQKEAERKDFTPKRDL